MTLAVKVALNPNTSTTTTEYRTAFRSTHSYECSEDKSNHDIIWSFEVQKMDLKQTVLVQKSLLSLDKLT